MKTIETVGISNITICGKDLVIRVNCPQQDDITNIREIMKGAKISMAELGRCGNPPKSRERVRQILKCSDRTKLRDSTMIWLRYALESAMRGGKK